MAWPEAEPTGVRPPLRSRSEILALLLIGLSAAWLYFWWVGWPQPRWTTPQPGGYDAALADAFLAGQLHLKITPPPELARLADPYDPSQYGPYQVMDLSYYQGRYYSYFGVAPVALLFLPWQAIAGSCLTEQFAAAFFTSASLTVALVLLVGVRRRYFRDAAGWLVILGGLVLAFGNFSLLLLEPPYYPQVQMASAWFWQIAALLCVYHALHSVRHPAGWTAAASLACGLAVASRPSYLLGVLLLVPLIWHLARWETPSPPASSRRLMRIVGAGFIPVVAVGVALMLYNHARFGSPFEFGMRYQQWGRDLRSQVFLSPVYLWPHLKAYLGGAPRIVRYFPFLLHQAAPVGALLFFPFCWLASLAPAGLTGRPPPEKKALAIFILSCAMALVGNLLLLAHYYLAWARYQLDFQPQFVWLAVVGLLAAAHAWRECTWKRRILSGGALPLAAINILTSFCFPSAAPYQPPAKTALLARVLDRPAACMEKSRGVTFGPMQLELEFPVGRAGRSEPILCTGTTLKDLLFVHYVDDTHIQIGLFHEGLGGPISDQIGITGGPRHLLDIGWGALCPPEQHPAFDGWAAPSITRARTMFHVRVDGRDLFAQDAMFHYSTPSDTIIGRTPVSFGFCDPAFTGRIVRSREWPLRPPPIRPGPTTGIIIDLRFDHRRIGYTEPLLATGRRSAFDVLIAQYLPDDRIRFGVDDSRAGAVYADPIRLPGDGVQHRLALWIQTRSAEAAPGIQTLSASHGEILLVCDDHLMLQRKLDTNPLKPGDSYYGVNPFGASSAEPMFAGRFSAVASAEPAIKSGQETRLPGCPVRLLVAFPGQNVGRSEPLVVTGVAGAGDLVYVRYLDRRRVQFGFDHWGIGGIVSNPVEIDPAAFHRIEVSIGSLYPVSTGPEGARNVWRQTVSVKLDGVSVLAGASPCHPAAPRQVYIGENPIGGSTCEDRFTGRLLLVERGTPSGP